MKALVVLSGGLDSTAALRLSQEQYDEVEAISFDYKQKQRVELELAAKSCARLGVKHQVLDISFLNDINKGFSANTDSDMEMPTIEDVLGEPQPVTYVANRNMILMSIAASYAETRGIERIICGFQVNDTYGYHDTSPIFVQKLNDVLDENRTHKIKIIAPFVEMSKLDELKAVMELDGNLDLFATTITCYNPDKEGKSCGVCPSCSERLNAFKQIGVKDPIAYVQEEVQEDVPESFIFALKAVYK